MRPSDRDLEVRRRRPPKEYPDYKVQVLKTRAQWESGFFSRLAVDDSGIGLFSTPNFLEWLEITPPRGRGPSAAIATDDCGRLFWLDVPPASVAGAGGVSTMWLYDPANDLYERLAKLDSVVAGGPNRLEPSRLWVTERTIWIHDGANDRLLGLTADTFQLTRAIDIGPALDVAFDGVQTFYVLEKRGDEFQVARYDSRYARGGQLRPWHCLDCDDVPSWVCPVGLSVNSNGVWVLDQGSPGRSAQFVHISPEDGDCRVVLIPRKPPADACPEGPGPRLDSDLVAERIETDCQGNLLVSLRPEERDLEKRRALRALRLKCGKPPIDEFPAARMAQFDPHGGLLGEIALPTKPATPGAERAEIAIERIDAIISGAGGMLFLDTDQGLAAFALEHVPVGESGTYYTRTLDNGREGGTWHRVAIRGELPTGTRLQVWAYAADDPGLRDSINEIIDGTRRPGDKLREIETRLGPLLHGDEEGVDRGLIANIQGGLNEKDEQGEDKGRAVKRDESPVNLNHDVLLTASNRGRYLWLKIAIASFDEDARPTLSEIQVFHPRTSYLRYLPITFGEMPGDPSADTPARDFLERFLSIFETRLWELDIEIDRLFEYFDPANVPPEFLPWLGSWLNLGVEEDWDESRTRRLISQAWRLYEAKGTPAGLADMIRVVTGRQARIQEDGRLLQPTPLGTNWRLGQNTFVRRGPRLGFRLGQNSRLGVVPLRRETLNAADPFAASAHRFTVLLFGDPAEVARDESLVRRLVDEHKPAHTEYTLRRVGEGSVGSELRVGMNTRLIKPSHLRLGENTSLGRSINVSRNPPPTRLGSSSRLGEGFELI